MQLNSVDEIEKIAPKNNFSIFELPETESFDKFFESSYHVTYIVNSDTGKMRREIVKPQIEEALRISRNKQNDALYIVIEYADTINITAANYALKSLEEPGENIHYIFLTHNINGIIPTIRSRANCYYIPSASKVSDPPKAEVDIFKLAKEYVSATPKTLPDVVEKIIKYDKVDTRQIALRVVSCSIEIMYKSYLLRGNPSFLQKIEQLIKTEQALDKNGHIKLQLVANML
ncbi:MAG: hypothetical protein MJ154_02860 [Candidatus Saccharibacteria bacterium]|nr:hypothetical protein [Candidatus Saccharibacteria bacterium]